MAVERGMAERAAPRRGMDDVDAVTQAVLTASRLLVAVSARSLGEVEERVTLPQLRMLVVLSTRGATKLVVLAELLQVAPSTAMRMVDRLITAGLALRQANPDNRRETLLQLTDEGRRTVEEVTARRRAEISAIVERLTPRSGPRSSRRSRPSTRRAANHPWTRLRRIRWGRLRPRRSGGGRGVGKVPSGHTVWLYAQSTVPLSGPEACCADHDPV